jgi:hypothetical protein
MRRISLPTGSKGSRLHVPLTVSRQDNFTRTAFIGAGFFLSPNMGARLLVQVPP